MTLKQHVIDILERAGKTFVETFLASFSLTSLGSGKSALTGLLGAVISAVWTTAVKLEANYKGSVEQAVADYFDDFEDLTDEEAEKAADAAGVSVTPPAPADVTPPAPTVPTNPVSA